jgi:hypothetical protein
MICPECGTEFEAHHPNQSRCKLCIEARPHKGAHTAQVNCEKYVRQARQRMLHGQVKHWHIGMGQAKLYAMFPDLRP